MDIGLYTNTSDSRCLNKVLSNEKIISDVYLLETTDVIKPSFIFARTDDTIFSTYNYLHAPTMNRYYFIQSIKLLDGERFQVDCEVDVLMSFRNDILSAEICPNRCGSLIKKEAFVRDKMVSNSVRHKQTIKKFSGSEFLELKTPNNYSCVITALGGTISNENN